MSLDKQHQGSKQLGKQLNRAKKVSLEQLRFGIKNDFHSQTKKSKIVLINCHVRK